MESERLAVQGQRTRRGLATFAIALHAAICVVWLVGWPVRWILYSFSIADDVRFYTNWNWLGTGLFFIGSLPGLVCWPRWDTFLHMTAFAALVFSNTLTFVAGPLVVADNGGLLFTMGSSWFVIFMGERFVHVYIALWVLIYAWIRMNDFAWMWQGHAHAARVICGQAICTCSFAALLLFQACLILVPLLTYNAFFSFHNVYKASTLSLVVSIGCAVAMTAIFLLLVMLRHPRAGKVLE